MSNIFRVEYDQRRDTWIGFRIDYDYRCGCWFVHRYNKAVGFWTYAYSAASKALCVQWCEQHSY